MSDRVAVIDGGSFRQIGLPRDIYERPKSRFIADFIGESYFLPVTVRDGAAYFRDRRLTAGPLPDGIGQRGHLVVRPEKLHVAHNGAAEEGANILDGRVREAVYQGESLLLLVTLDSGEEIAARLPSSSQAATPDVGARVSFALASADTVVVPEDVAR